MPEPRLPDYTAESRDVTSSASGYQRLLMSPRADRARLTLEYGPAMLAEEVLEGASLERIRWSASRLAFARDALPTPAENRARADRQVVA